MQSKQKYTISGISLVLAAKCSRPEPESVRELDASRRQCSYLASGSPEETQGIAHSSCRQNIPGARALRCCWCTVQVKSAWQSWDSELAPYLQNKRLNFGVAHTLGLEFVAIFAHLMDLSCKAVFTQLGLDGLHTPFGDDYNIGSGPDWVVVHLKHVSVAGWGGDYTTNLTGYVVMQTTVVGPISHSPSTALFLL